jgi:hypothetical protein
LSISW